MPRRRGRPAKPSTNTSTPRLDLGPKMPEGLLVDFLPDPNEELEAFSVRLPASTIRKLEAALALHPGNGKAGILRWAVAAGMIHFYEQIGEHESAAKLRLLQVLSDMEREKRLDAWCAGRLDAVRADIQDYITRGMLEPAREYWLKAREIAEQLTNTYWRQRFLAVLDAPEFAEISRPVS